MLKRLHDWIEKHEPPNWVVYILFLVVILRIPSLFEPFHYGDEMIYITLGNAIKKGLTLYSEVHDNKPPLLYLTAAIAGNVFWFRAILLFWSLGTTILFYKLTAKLFTLNTRIQKVAVLVFAVFTTLPLLEGQIANAENFMVGFTIAGFLLLINNKSPTTRTLLVSGLMFSIAALFKIPAVFDVPAVVIYWLLTEKKLTRGSLIKIAKNTAVLVIGFLAPIILSLIYYYFAGAFSEYLIAAYLQNVGYLSSFRPDDQQLSFWVKNGPLLTRFGITIALTAFTLYLSRTQRVSAKFAFLTCWLILTLFAVALPERPYPHYLIQTLPPAALLVGILFTSPKKEQLYSLFPLGLLFLVPVYFGFWHYSTSEYYLRFFRYATGGMDRAGYLQSFGAHVPRDYEISEFVLSLSSPDSSLFVWGDNGATYALTGLFPPTRYIVDYHIEDFSSREEILGLLTANPPEFIVITNSADDFEGLDELLNKDYSPIKQAAGYSVWTLTTQGQ